MVQRGFPSPAATVTESCRHPTGSAEMKHPVSRRRLPGVALWFCLLALFAAAPLTALRAAPLTEDDFKQWSLLAIQDDGRRKPIDTYARESLLRLTGGSFMGIAVYKDHAGRVWHPNDFLLSVLVSEPADHVWKAEPLVLVNYRPLVVQLGLDGARKRFSYNELSALPKLLQMATDIRALRARVRDPQLSREQQEVENVSSRLVLFNRLLTGEALVIAPPLRSGERVVTSAADMAAATASVSRGEATARGAWLVPPEASNVYGEARFAPVLQTLRDAVGAYEAGDSFKFNLAARNLRAGLRSLNPAIYPADSALSTERAYNHLGAFPWASLLYAGGFLLLLAGGEGRHGLRRALRWGGIGAGLAGLAMHATGIALRCAVAGRPPVTNMYESMIWVAFVVVALGFIFFALYRATPYLLAALPVGCLVLLLVQQIPVAVPGSIEPLQPVLRDNFWLATHVLTETASYGAFALAMGFGHILLARYILDPAGARRDHALHFWLYRVLQLGVLLLAVGTILGAVWANYSWGRYWGWDPKETWAFITFLCYIVAIHGRIAGWWGQFGLAVASVACFAAVVMAWYGVNFWLGKGLHSYGRGVGGEGYVAGLLILDAAFLALACWRHAQTTGRNGGGPGATVPVGAVVNSGEAGLPVAGGR